MLLGFKHKNHDNSINGNLISLWTGYPYIHAFIIFDNGLVASAWKDGVQYKTIDEVIKNDKHFIFYELPDTINKYKAELFFDSQIGKSFDWKGSFFNHVLHINIENKKEWFCSEITIKLLSILYPESIFGSLNPAEISPGKLQYLISKTSP